MKFTPFAAVTTAAALALTALVAAPAVAADLTPIAAVQGTGDATPILGQTVTVEGVVTGYYGQPSNYRGLYLQTAGSGGAAADATPGASDGVFVYFNAANPAVAVGDLIQVTGVAGENGSQTQVSATTPAAFTIVTAGVGVPEATPLPDTAVGAAREALEGMLVQPTGTYTLASTHELYNFGSLWLTAGPAAVVPTEVADAGSPEAVAIAADNLARRLVVDDGYSIRVDNALHVGEQPYFTKDTVVRLGDTYVAPAKAMILGYGFNLWRLQPQTPLTDASPAEYKPTFTATNPRPASAPVVGGDVQFGSFNVFNYFTTLSSVDGNARGAATAAQFAIQKSKIVAAINGLGADIVALEEVQNSATFGQPVDTALADLVGGLNAAAGAGTWDYVRSPAALSEPGNDAIMTAIIFKPSLAEPVGASFADTDAVWSIARKPVAQTFDIGGRDVTVIANHLKSKSAPAGGGTEPADGQGFFNTERTAQANRLVTFVEGITADPAKGDDVIMLGDFNAYGQEDPVQALTAAGFTDLVPSTTDDQYTYSFNGALGSLDHAFATPSLASAVTGVGVWGINSSEWSDRGYAYPATEAGTPWRASDHDPVVVGVTSAAVPVTIDLLSINDFHGRLEADPAANVAGAAVLAGTVKSYEAANPNTLFVGAGDLIGASTFTSFIADDQPTIDAFNAMGLDASSFGNHEFDKGRADVDDRILEEADWPYLAANIYDTSTGAPAYQQYEIRDMSGVKVAFVGAVTEDLPTLVSPGGISTLDVKPVVTEVNRVADQLSDGDASNDEADVIVLLVHEGAETPALASATNDSKFGRIVTGADANIDMIISGHTHLAYDHEIPIPGTDKVRPVISSGQYGEKYAHTTLTVDGDSHELISATSDILPLPGAAAPDAEVAAIVAAAKADADVLGAVQLGSVTADVLRGKTAAGAESRASESTIGNLIADAQLAAATDLGAQVAIMNPGGIRADLAFAPDGSITFREAATVQPFANTLVTLDLTGAQLKQVLEQQWQPAGAARPFLKLGVSKGLTYTYDPTAASGARIGTVYLNGVAVTPGQVVKVVTNSFLSTGGDNFTAFTSGANKADSGRIDLDAFVDYFDANSPVAPDFAQRAVGVAASAPATGTEYAVGESVTLTLSSLLFSNPGNGGPAAGNATVSLASTLLGSAPIDATLVDTTDESGRATVTFTIPAGISGAQVLTIGGPGGTAVSYPITVAAPVVPPTPVKTATYGAASKLLSFGGQGITYTTRVVAADGSKPVGTVAIYDGSKLVATVPVTTDANGRVTVTLPKLSRGIHLLTARFAGDGYVGSRAFPSLVLVL